MKKIVSILAISISILITHSAFAEGYFGAGGSSVSTPSISGGINADIIAGINMSDNFALELALDFPVIKGKTSSVNDIGTQTTAGYAVYRSGSDGYFKAKAGYHSTTVTVGSSSSTIGAIAYGIGMGFGDGYEVDYTILTPETGSDNITKISLTVMF